MPHPLTGLPGATTMGSLLPWWSKLVHRVLIAETCSRSEAVEVIDEDKARSGTTTEGRSGFARLADAVAHGEAGGVLAVDVSRMARSSEDWRRLLGLCGVAGVAVVDQQRIYDPNNQDDKLLLELKGTMSEAEIHWLRLRLQGARQHKARRGALRMPASTGYLWGDRG